MWVNGSFSETMFNSIINCKVAFQVVVPFFSLITRNEYFCCYLCQYLLSWVIMEFSHSNRCIVYLLVVVIYISLRTMCWENTYSFHVLICHLFWWSVCSWWHTGPSSVLCSLGSPPRSPGPVLLCPSHNVLHLHKVLWTYSPAELWWDCKALPSAIV